MFQSNKDRLLTALVIGMAAIAGSIVVIIAIFVVKESIPAMTHIGGSRFLTDESWHPADDAPRGQFNLLPILLGTVLSSMGAICVAAPLGVLSAVFCQFYAPLRVARWYRMIIELMAGVPSVVFGLWGLVVLVPIVASIHPPGQSLFTGIIILTLMILPTVVLLTDAAFSSVSHSYRQGAAALGLSRATTVLSVMIPAAWSGIVTAVLLGLVRALGETMAVVMVCGNVVRLPKGLFDPVRTLTGTIALEMGYARGDHRASLFFCGMVLLILVAVLVASIEIANRRGRHDTT
mgnify:CR=1 FL=1